MNHLKDFLATVLLFALAVGSVLLVESAVSQAFYRNTGSAPKVKPEEQVLPVLEIKPDVEVKLKEVKEFDIDRVIAREMATLRAAQHDAGRKIWTAGFLVKTFGKPLPVPVVNSFANSFGSQLMVQGLLLQERISDNPAIAFGQGFLIGL
jgi:hypothetical protein